MPCIAQHADTKQPSWVSTFLPRSFVHLNETHAVLNEIFVCLPVCVSDTTESRKGFRMRAH